MASLNKILLGLFFFLMLLIIGEVIFLFMSNKQIANQSQANQVDIPSNVKLFPTTYPQQALKENQLVNLRTLKKGVVKIFSVHYVYEGKVVASEQYTTEGLKGFHLGVVADNGNRNDFYYVTPPTDIRVIRAGNEQVISLSQIQKGNFVQVSSDFDFLNVNIPDFKSDFKNVTIKVIK